MKLPLMVCHRSGALRWLLAWYDADEFMSGLIAWQDLDNMTRTFLIWQHLIEFMSSLIIWQDLDVWSIHIDRHNSNSVENRIEEE